MERKWNFLSLFDGISCFQVALQKLGITNYNYYASEIDEYAMRIAKKNFPSTKYLGNVVDWKSWKFDFPIDLIVAGFPCQDLSQAKKDRKGLDGERSGLFWYFKDIVDWFNPTYFIGENVESLKTPDYVIISNALGVKPIMLDSALVSAQRRKRYFWTNIPNVKKPELKRSKVFPDNKIGIVIADILEPLAERKILNIDPETISKTSYGIRWYVNKNAKKAKQNQSLENHKAYDSLTKHPSIMASRTISRHNVINCEAHRAYALHNKHAVVVASRTHSKTNIVTEQPNYVVEQLTWTEIERLQGLPDGYTDLGKGNKVEARGRAIGNGFQVDIFAHLLSFMLKRPKPVEMKSKVFAEQPKLFE